MKSRKYYNLQIFLYIYFQFIEIHHFIYKIKLKNCMPLGMHRSVKKIINQNSHAIKHASKII
jgi:hypothetical protein